MNLGTVTDGSPAMVVTIGIVLGLAGLAAVYGLIRRMSWGPIAGLTICALNLVAGVIGLIAGWEGSVIGIGVSIVALILTAVGESAALRSRGIATAR